MLLTERLYISVSFIRVQAWRGRKRQARGHRLPSIQGEWLTIDDQKNNLLASLCLVSYLAVNWLENPKQNIVFITQKLFLFLCVWYLSLIYL